MTLLAVAGLDKRFGAHQVLAGLDLDVPAGGMTSDATPDGFIETAAAQHQNKIAPRMGTR